MFIKHSVKYTTGMWYIYIYIWSYCFRKKIVKNIKGVCFYIVSVHRQKLTASNQGRRARYQSATSQRAKSCDHEVVRVQKKVSKGHPNIPPKSCTVVWSRILKYNVKSYATRPSTQCYFNEFIFMRVLTHDNNRINQAL